MSARARLVLVRHGESTWNADGILQGQADPPLSLRGRRQVRALAPLVRALQPDGAVTSDLARAHESAALLGWPGAPRDPAWRELDLGAWTGRPSAEVRAEDDEAFAAWRTGRRAPPEGETYAAFGERVERAARTLLAVGGTWVVVCHGGPIRLLVTRMLGLGPGRVAGVANASATVLEDAGDGVRLVAFNLVAAGSEARDGQVSEIGSGVLTVPSWPPHRRR